jgi:hypothetical protein
MKLRAIGDHNYNSIYRNIKYFLLKKEGGHEF